MSFFFNREAAIQLLAQEDNRVTDSTSNNELATKIVEYINRTSLTDSKKPDLNPLSTESKPKPQPAFSQDNPLTLSQAKQELRTCSDIQAWLKAKNLNVNSTVEGIPVVNLLLFQENFSELKKLIADKDYDPYLKTRRGNHTFIEIIFMRYIHYLGDISLEEYKNTGLKADSPEEYKLNLWRCDRFAELLQQIIQHPNFDDPNMIIPYVLETNKRSLIQLLSIYDLGSVKILLKNPKLNLKDLPGFSESNILIKFIQLRDVEVLKALKTKIDFDRFTSGSAVDFIKRASDTGNPEVAHFIFDEFNNTLSTEERKEVCRYVKNNTDFFHYILSKLNQQGIPLNDIMNESPS